MAGSSFPFHDQEPPYPWTHCLVVPEDAMYLGKDILFVFVFF